MTEQHAAAISRYTETLVTDFPRHSHFTTRNGCERIQGQNGEKFITARVALLFLLLSGEKTHPMSLPLACEHAVKLALQEALRGTGFTIQLSPQNLESGEKTKGVDLLICGAHNEIYLGIDVKLRPNKSKYDRDGCGWHAQLAAPFIYLSLGAFQVDTLEAEQIDIRTWFQDYVIPSFEGSGQFPKFHDFRAFLLRRIERSLYARIERTLYPYHDQKEFEATNSAEEEEMMQTKLAVLHSLFYELQQA